MTPTHTSAETVAREWFDLQQNIDTPALIASLAALIERERLMAKIEQVGDMERYKYECMRLGGGVMRFNSDWIPILQERLAQLAAQTRREEKTI